jgi:predicted O-methyltransferase YrrM
MSRLFGANIYKSFRPTKPLDLQGWNSIHPALANSVADIRPSVILDVGVWKGGSTVFLANLLRENSIDGVVIAIDTFLGSPEHWDRASVFFDELCIEHGQPNIYWQFLSNILHEGCQDRVIPLVQTTDNAALILDRLGIRAQLIHLDAAHEYQAILRDAQTYWNLLSPGGALIGDDYDEAWPGVVRAANEFAKERCLSLEISRPKWVVRKPLTCEER